MNHQKGHHPRKGRSSAASPYHYTYINDATYHVVMYTCVKSMCLCKQTYYVPYTWQCKKYLNPCVDISIYIYKWHHIFGPSNHLMQTWWNFLNYFAKKIWTAPWYLRCVEPYQCPKWHPPQLINAWWCHQVKEILLQMLRSLINYGK